MRGRERRGRALRSARRLRRRPVCSGGGVLVRRCRPQGPRRVRPGLERAAGAGPREGSAMFGTQNHGVVAALRLLRSGAALVAQFGGIDGEVRGRGGSARGKRRGEDRHTSRARVAARWGCGRPCARGRPAGRDGAGRDAAAGWRGDAFTHRDGAMSHPAWALDGFTRGKRLRGARRAGRLLRASRVAPCTRREGVRGRARRLLRARARGDPRAFQEGPKPRATMRA